MNHLLANSFHKPTLWVILVVCLFLTACQSTAPHQTYEGSPKADSEVANFTVPGQFNLLSIDGVKHSQPILRDGATIKLLPGSHQFIIEYQDFWENQSGDHDRIESKPIAVTFTAEAGNQYKIASTPLESIEQARDFAQQPTISVVNATSNQPISAEIKTNLYGKGLFATLFGTPTPEPAHKPISMPVTKTPNKDGKALEMLKYWWETADEGQKGNFRQWLEAQ